MIEKDFLELIDCNFPYNDTEKWLRLIDLSLSISNNCIFNIIYELINIPYGLKRLALKKNITMYLDYIDKNFSHELKETILTLAKEVLKWKKVEISDVLERMDVVKKYNWENWALNILYMSWNDKDWKLEKKYNWIIKYWKNSISK